jgi:hypothetical protein
MSAEELPKYRLADLARRDRGECLVCLDEDPTLRETLKQPETEGVDRRNIYDSTYDD